MSASGALDAHDSATRPTPTLMTMAWSVRRELWENRWVWAAPFAAGVIFLFAYLVSLLTLPERMSAALSAPPEQRHELIVQPYVLAAVLMIGTGVVVGVFYSLDALYSERRDRSVLFWRSLPVADVTAVLAKATIPIVILPLLTGLATILLHLLMLVLSSVTASLSGSGVGPLWREVAPWRLAPTLMYHVSTIHVFWYAPVFAWLLLASAWARRAPFLWAGLPILAIAVVERLAFGSSTFVAALKSRVTGNVDVEGSPHSTMGTLAHIRFGDFIRSTELWAGLLIAAVALVAAVHLRKRRATG
jgi:ABC-2 type transport system permease protein